MSATTREGRLLDALAALADTLVADYDVVELMQTLVESCIDLLDVHAAGLLLVDARGRLELVASTSEENRVVEAMQLSVDAGPCIDAYTHGRVVSVPDLEQVTDRWAEFREAARRNSARAAYAIPLRLRETVIGTLNLFRERPGEFDSDDMRAAQALADMATIGILHERSHREADQIRAQLQNALNSRVVIEQAKGVLAQTHRLSVEAAFALLRNYARNNQQPLSEVARRLVDRTLIF